MTEPSPTVAVHPPKWDNDGQRWLTAATINLPWLPTKIIVVEHDGSVQRPAREAFKMHCLYRLLVEVKDYLDRQVPYVPGIEDDEFVTVTGLLDPYPGDPK